MRDNFIRYTMDFNSDVYKELKLLAAQTNVSMSSLIEDIVVMYLHEYHQIEFEKHPDQRTRTFYKKK